MKKTALLLLILFLNSVHAAPLNIISPQSITYTNPNVWFNLSLTQPMNTATFTLNNQTPVNLSSLNSTFFYKQENLVNEGVHQAIFSASNSTDVFNTSPVDFNLSLKPFINNLRVNPLILLSELNTVNASITEENPDQVWVNISTTNHYSIYHLTNNSANNHPSPTNWSYIFNNASLTGLYNLTLSVNDSLGNKANQSTSFRVTNPINFNFSCNNNLTLKIKYDDGVIREEAVNNSSLTIPNGSWNLELNGNEVVINLREVNLSRNLNESFLLQENASFSQHKNFIIHKVLSFETNLTFHNATIKIPFNTLQITNHLRVMKCDRWNNIVNDCDSDWFNVTSDSTITRYNIYVNTSSFSAFSIVENCEVSCDSWSDCNSGSQTRDCTRANCETYTDTRNCGSEEEEDDDEEDENNDYVAVTINNVLNNSDNIKSNVTLIEDQLSILHEFLMINRSHLVNNLLNNISTTLSIIEDNNTALHDKLSLLEAAQWDLNNVSLAVPEVRVLTDTLSVINQTNNSAVISLFNNQIGASAQIQSNLSLIKSLKKIMVKDKNTNHTSHYVLIKNQLTNPFNQTIYNISLVESIPKTYAESVNDIIFHEDDNLIVIQEDPVIAWFYNKLDGNETVTNSYVIPEDINGTSGLINNSILRINNLTNKLSVNNESAIIIRDKEPINWVLISLTLILILPLILMLNKKRKQWKLKKLIKNK